MTFLFSARLFAYATIFAVGGDRPVLIGRLGTLVGAISVGAADLPGLDDRRWRGARTAEAPLLVRRCARGCRRPRLVVAVARLRSTVFPGCPRRAPINCSAMPAIPSMTARKSVRPESRRLKRCRRLPPECGGIRGTGSLQTRRWRGESTANSSLERGIPDAWRKGRIPRGLG